MLQYQLVFYYKSKKPVVVDYWAPWCGPCRAVGPVVEQLAAERADSVKVAKLNVDEAREVSIKYGVTSVPTFLFIKDGEVKGRETGYISKDNLLEKIKAALD